MWSQVLFCTDTHNRNYRLRDALNSYPQGGQEGGKVDGGGYSFVSDKDGNFVLEYKSGLGFFAKAFNGYVDFAS